MGALPISPSKLKVIMTDRKDRKQNDVLARELSLQYWNGVKNPLKIDPDTDFLNFIDEHWEKWKDLADTILNNLEYHTKK